MTKRFSTYTCFFAFMFVLALNGGTDSLVAAPQGKYQALDLADKYRLTPEPPESAGRKAKSEWLKRNRPALREIKTGSTALKKLIESGGDISSAPERGFLEGYVFSSMTQMDASTISSLGDRRRQFLKDYLDDDITGAARQKLIEVTVENMSKMLVNDALHPSARINAAVLLTRLNDRPANRSQGVTPIPSSKAFDALLSLFSENDDKRAPAYLKCTALSGLKHHIETNVRAGRQIDGNTQQQLLGKLSQIIQAPADAKKAPADYWQKRLAIQLAGLIGNSGTIDSVVKVLADEDASFAMKLDAIKTIDRVGAMDSSADRNGEVLVEVCKFASIAVDAEGKQIKSDWDQLIYDNMLYADEDLLETGIDFEEAVPAKTGPASAGAAGGAGNGGFGGMDGGMDGGLGGMDGGFGGMDGGMDGGLGGMDGGFGGMDGGFDGLATEDKKKPVVELPNFMLQNSRTRIKSVAFYCRRVIGESKEKGLRRFLDAKMESLAGRAAVQLKQLLDDSDTGIVDLSIRNRTGLTEEEKDSEREESYAIQMVKICSDASEKMTELLKELKGE